MIRLVIAMFILGLGLVGHGLQGTYEGVQNRSPRVLTAAQFEKERPTGGWITIKNCNMTIADAMAEEGGGDKVYLPVYATPSILAAPQPSRHALMLLETSDPALVEGQLHLHIMDQNNASPQAIKDWINGNPKLFFIHKDLTGMLMHGMDALGDEDRAQFTKLDSSLDPNFVVMEEGKQPDLGGSTLSLAGGILLILFSVGLGIVRFRSYGS